RGSHHIESAIAVHIAGIWAIGLVAGGAGAPTTEGGIPVPTIDQDRGSVLARDGDVGPAVLVEVRDHRPARGVAGGEIPGCVEGTIAAAAQNRPGPGVAPRR